MKNSLAMSIAEQFPPNTLVPLEKRLEVYEKALSIISNPLNEWCSEGLCLLLPMILWDLPSYLNKPDNQYWDYRHTPNMFPEIKKFLYGIKYHDGNKIPKRIEALTEIIAELNQETK